MNPKLKVTIDIARDVCSVAIYCTLAILLDKYVLCTLADSFINDEPVPVVLLIAYLPSMAVLYCISCISFILISGIPKRRIIGLASCLLALGGVMIPSVKSVFVNGAVTSGIMYAVILTTIVWSAVTAYGIIIEDEDVSIWRKISYNPMRY